MEKIDPATNLTIQEFLNLFVVDPVLRLEVEAWLEDEVRINPYYSGNGLESLASFNSIYQSAKHEGARKLIAYGANAAVLGMLEQWRKRQEAR